MPQTKEIQEDSIEIYQSVKGYKAISKVPVSHSESPSSHHLLPLILCKLAQEPIPADTGRGAGYILDKSPAHHSADT